MISIYSKLSFSFAGHHLLSKLQREILSDCMSHTYDSFVVVKFVWLMSKCQVCLFICQVHMGMEALSFGPGAAYVNIQKRVDNHS